ncbi:autotransporter outer membrane beta-barrel domain-containing protein [Allosphingosinicella deserti]|uniref:autotransporter outer membrane beta-barrel domain-containing protein n=1 Tax=Allosphingosinicella deserti TaxID=2116704 RepID=UPI0011B235D5|nr:autotransporter outer membrane beta-barrel domain-containing protein [Sphingomonas deserti]
MPAYTSASLTALAVALAVGAVPVAQAQQITRGGGNSAGGIAGGGGGRGGGGGDGGVSRGGAGGSAATTPDGLAQAGSNGTNPTNGAPGGPAGTPNDISAGGGGGGGGRRLGPDPQSGTGGAGGAGGHMEARTGAFSLSADHLGSTGGNGVGGNGGSGGGGGGSGGLVLTGFEVNVETAGRAVTGGTGGKSTSVGGASIVGVAGGGGAGLVLLQGGALTISGGSAIAGGAGGTLADYGGGGGAGLFLYAGGTLVNQTGSILGGNGGGIILGMHMGGDGGAGVLSNLGTIANQAVIKGGDGGVAMYIGGAGGIGAVAWGGSIDNAASGVISGGQGATIRNAGETSKPGVGGAGILFRDGQSASLINSGTIAGGAAGATPYGDNVVGAGGVGVTGAATGNISIINSGTITGGLNSRNAVRSDAIALFGSGNRVELRAGSTIDGNVVVSGGSDNALVLGGSAGSSLDVSLVGELGQYRGFDRFEKIGASNWTLTGTGDQDWSITSGSLKGDTNSLGGDLSFGTSDGDRDAIFDQAFDGTYGGILSGDGVVIKTGTGAMTMTGVPAPGDTFTGLVQVDSGALVLNGTVGDRAGKTAQLRVEAGAMLGGSGTFLGNVTVADGGIVGPGSSPGTLTIAGNYTLGAGTVLRYELGQPGVVGSGTNDLIVVGGNLTLDGSLEVTALPDFGAGYYRLIDYAGTLTDNELAVGTTPAGFTGTVQTGIAGQVNILFNDGAQRVQYWDGADATGSSAAVNGDGGTGVWRAAGTNWTAASGFGVNDGWAGQAGVFAGVAGGTVTVEGTQSFQRLRFDTAGYVLEGGALATTGGFSIIEVNAATTINTAIAGGAGLTKTGAGALTMGGANSYSGRTTVSAGSLSLATGGQIAGGLHNEASFSNAGTVDGLVTNVGTLSSTGTLNGTLINQGVADLSGQVQGRIENHGTIALTGALSGVTRLSQGELGSLDVAGFEMRLDVLDGQGSVAMGGGKLVIGSSGRSSEFAGTIAGGGTVTIAGGSFQGTGTIDATMVVADGAHLNGVQGTTLSVGSLMLAAGSQLDVTLGTPSTAPLFDIDRNLTLDGVINVSASPAFGVGVYRLFDYGGALTDNGLELGAVSGATGYQLSIQGGAGRVNLVNTAGATLAFWDGGAVGFHNNGAVDGGSGTWSTGGANWTTVDGGVNSAMTPQPGFAVFQRSGGTVTIDDTAGQVSATGMQFATNGYTLEGSPIALAGERAVIRVGDGSAAGAGMRATIAASLSGQAALVKLDLGTLVLSGANSYTGDTIISDGALSLSAGGVIAGAVRNDASFSNAGTVNGPVTNAGTFASTGTLDGSLVNQGAANLAGQLRGSIENNGTVALTGALSGVTRLYQATGASLDAAGFDLALDALDGGGSIALGGGTLAIGAAGTSSTFGGTITGGGTVTIAAGIFQGTGTIDGAVVVADGAHLNGIEGSSLSIGALRLGAGSQLDVTLGAPSGVALFDIGGDLTLDGTVNVSAGPAFGAGIYRLLDYRGALTDNGLELGAVTGASGAGLSVQSGAGHVNLVNTAGVTLAFWDGGAAAIHNNGAVDGGSGTWSTGGANWTTVDGGVNSAMTPQPGFAVFQGSPGTVKIDNTAGQVTATGMQFAADGYTLEGGPIALAGERAVIRVGDGSAAGAGMRATLAASLTGQAALVKSDLGTLVLSGANSYTGGTLVEAGTLVGDLNSLHGDIANNSTLVFDVAANGTFGGSVTGAGATIKSGAGALTLAGANATNWQVSAGSLITTSKLFAGNVDLKAGAALVFDQAAAGTYSGTIVGNGTIAVRGGGSIAFTGNGSAFLGTTNVAGGQLLSINGTLGGMLDIAAAARLQGSGTAGSANVTGTIAPGNSIGTLTFSGNLALAPGSVYEVEADASGASDRIIVGGTASIGSNAAVNVLAADGNYAPKTSYTILTAGQGVTGTFASVTSNLAFLTPTLDYSANAVTLNLRRNSVDFATVGETHNQIEIAPAVEALGPGSDVYDAVIALTASEARDAFDQLSGSGHASVRSQLLEDSRFVRDAMVAREGVVRGAGMTLWGRVLGSWATSKVNRDAPGYERDLEGLLTGFDGGLGENLRAGVALGYSKSDIHGKSGRHEIQSYHAGGYLMGTFGAFSLAVGGAYAWNEVQASRRVAFGTFEQTISGDYSARTLQTFGEAAFKGELGGIILQPFLSLAHVRLFDAEIREQGGGAALRGGKSTARVTWGNLGIRTKADIGLNGLGLRFAGSVALRHAFGDRSPDVDLALTGGSTFSVIGAGIERNSIAIDGGLEADLTQNLVVSISYTGNHGKRINDHGARASLAWRF